ncbi:phage integrase family protein [Alteromonas sp. 76-1]|jgi:site-specific recombinase XerD|nr:phage integrase family protein [Alteromonas sp. 76-1]
MSYVMTAKSPCLDFLITSQRRNEKHDCSLSLIMKKGGGIDWHANAYLTKLGGGAQIFNIRPLAPTVTKKAYSLNIFCSFLEDKKISLSDINDSALYQFIGVLKDRKIADETVLTHARVALGYVIFLSDENPHWKLATEEKDTVRAYSVHYSEKKFKAGNREITYVDHVSFAGLISIAVDVEYIHDHEFVLWLDAINESTYHPELNEFLIYRWQAFSTLLEITGARISEVHQITKSSVENASKSLLNSKKCVLRDIPILKGKYKGKKREVEVTGDDLQIIMYYLKLVENTFPNQNHDAIFVDARSGKPLAKSYLKNYAKKVINASKYKEELRHVTNHSFRHRFITMNVAKAIKKLAASGSFNNILSVAATACRKVTMHASNATMARYVHLASELNHQSTQLDSVLLAMSSQVRIRMIRMINISKSLKAKKIDETEAIQSLLTNIDEIAKFDL